MVLRRLIYQLAEMINKGEQDHHIGHSTRALVKLEMRHFCRGTQRLICWRRLPNADARTAAVNVEVDCMRQTNLVCQAWHYQPRLPCLYALQPHHFGWPNDIVATARKGLEPKTVRAHTSIVAVKNYVRRSINENKFASCALNGIKPANAIDVTNPDCDVKGKIVIASHQLQGKDFNQRQFAHTLQLWLWRIMCEDASTRINLHRASWME